MTQIRNMAKITPLKTKTPNNQRPKDIMTTFTTQKPRGNGNNQGFKNWLAARHNDQLNLQDIILVALEELQEPVSTQEMQHYLKTEANIDIIDYRVKYALEQLVTARKAVNHLETAEERKIRLNGIPATSKRALLYNSGVTARQRKTAVKVDGYQIFDPRSLADRPRKAKPKAVVASTPTTAVPSTAAIDYLIEKLVADRTRDLQKQLDEANAKLAQFKKLLS